MVVYCLIIVSGLAFSGCFSYQTTIQKVITEPEVEEYQRPTDKIPRLRLVASLSSVGLKVGVRMAAKNCANVRRETGLQITQEVTRPDSGSLALNFIVSSLMLAGGVTLLALAPGMDSSSETKINDEGEEYEAMSSQTWGYIGGVALTLGGVPYTIGNIVAATSNREVKVKSRKRKTQETVLGPAPCSNNGMAVGHSLYLEIDGERVEIPNAAIAGKTTLWVRPGQSMELVEAVMDNPAPETLSIVATYPTELEGISRTKDLDPRSVKYLLNDEQRQELKRNAELAAEKLKKEKEERQAKAEAERKAAEQKVKRREKVMKDLGSINSSCRAIARKIKSVDAERKKAGSMGEVDLVIALTAKKKKVAAELRKLQGEFKTIKSVWSGDEDEALQEVLRGAAKSCN